MLADLVLALARVFVSVRCQLFAAAAASLGSSTFTRHENVRPNHVFASSMLRKPMRSYAFQWLIAVRQPFAVRRRRPAAFPLIVSCQLSSLLCVNVTLNSQRSPHFLI